MNLIEQIHNSIAEAGFWSNSSIIARNGLIKPPHTTDTNLYFIESGSVKVAFQSDTEEHIIRLGYKNNIIATLDSFISENASDLYIQALRKTVIKAASKAALKQLLKTNSTFAQLWHNAMEQLVYQQIERERDILCASPVERYKRVLARSPHLFQEVPNKYIAAYLRMTPETLSRIQKS